MHQLLIFSSMSLGLINMDSLHSIEPTYRRSCQILEKVQNTSDSRHLQHFFQRKSIPLKVLWNHIFFNADISRGLPVVASSHLAESRQLNHNLCEDYGEKMYKSQSSNTLFEYSFWNYEITQTNSYDRCYRSCYVCKCCDRWSKHACREHPNKTSCHLTKSCWLYRNSSSEMYANTQSKELKIWELFRRNSRISFRIRIESTHRSTRDSSWSKDSPCRSE